MLRNMYFTFCTNVPFCLSLSGRRKTEQENTGTVVMKNKVLLLLIGQAAALLFAFPGYAGSWYLRGSLGYEWSCTADFSDRNSLSTSPPALFGYVTGSDGRPIGAYGDFGKFPGFEIAAGRNVLPWLRADLSLCYRPDMDYRGHANFAGVPGQQPVRSEAHSLGLLGNVFLELAPLLNMSSSRLRPYVGGGLGITCNRLDRMIYEFPGLTNHKVSITPAGEKNDFTFMLTAGTGIVLSDRVILDIAYRYADLGQMRTDQGNMYMNNLPGGIVIGETLTRLRCHGITLGIRYSF
jgi:opacity protein-like surface antigen